MKTALSRPIDGKFEADGGEVQSKGPMAVGSRCSSWTDQKHMRYLSSLEESFVTQLHGSEFHLHLMNLLGRSQTNQRQSDSSITTETLSDSSQFQVKTLQQGSQEDLKFVKAKLGVQKRNASLSSSENQWIKHFAPNFTGKGVNIRANCQSVHHQSSYSSKPVKRELCCYSKESTSQAQPSFLSQNGDGYEEASDQNFINEDTTGAESSQTYKKKRLSSPVPPVIDQQVVLGKEHLDAIIEKG